MVTSGNKSLRQLAKEWGGSHSYLSQVLSGKRPASEKIAYRLSREGLLSVTGKQMQLPEPARKYRKNKL